MKKKLIPLILAPVCAMTCAFSLAACGGEEEEKMYHSAKQWSAAFSDPGTRECYSFSENGENDSAKRLEYDKNIGYYDYHNTLSKAVGKTIVKNEGFYYVRYEEDKTNKPYEILPADVAKEINGNSQISIAEKLLDVCKNSYADFKPSGKSESSDGTGVVVKEHCYKATNVSFRIDENHNILLEEVNVNLDDADASLSQISASFARGSYHYTNYDSFAETAGYYYAPDRLGGKTFRLVDIYFLNVPEAAVEGYNGWKQNVLNANKDKTITAKADGTLEGNIEIDMSPNGALAVNTMTYTENFFRGSGYGDIKVTNGLEGAQEVTLTGNLANGFNGVGNYNDVFKLEMTLDSIDYTFYFAVQGTN